MRVFLFLTVLCLAFPAQAGSFWWPPQNPQPVEVNVRNTVAEETPINITNEGDMTVHEAERIDKLLDDHAESVPESESFSHPDFSPCGDSTGAAGQTGPLGLSAATVSETCRAYRLHVLRDHLAHHSDSHVTKASMKLATISHFALWPFRLIGSAVTLGVLH